MSYSIRFPRRHDRPNKNGQYAVRLCVTKNSLRKYISLGIFADPEHWDEANEIFKIYRNLKGERQKAENEQRKNDNALLDKYKVRARDIIARFEIDGIDWTLSQFEDAFWNKTRQDKFEAYFESVINTLRETNHLGNAQCHSDTLRILRKYDRKLGERLFSDIDLRYIRGFDKFLQKRRNRANTRRYYMKTVRSVLNKAIAEGVAPQSTYPFGKGKYEVDSLKEVTAKRYLSPEYLDKIKNWHSDDPKIEYSRLLFLFSYYCYGISFVDMAQLSAKNIKRIEDGDYIVYVRQKIRNLKEAKPIAIKISPEIKELIGTLRASHYTLAEYLLPVISSADLSGEPLRKHIAACYNRYQRGLFKLAKEIGITDIRLTTYVSRHTFAMTLQRNSIPREIISQMMGHSDMQTTRVYLDSFDNTVIDEAAKVL
ncbi:MAG: site-specific integrase [Alistipes sp.]|nr:site-specific integrase [Alistipes sp.]